MEPRIQYAKTSDGVSIAYYRIGEGPPLVWTSNYFGSHLSEQWRVANGAFRPVSIERLAESFTVFRYDARGSGLSQREPYDFSLEARLLDLDAVVDRSPVRPVAVFGMGHGALAAIAYAAKYPDRVTALIVRNPYPRGAKLYETSPMMRLVAALGDVTAEQWEFVTLTIAQRGIVEDPGLAPELARLYRESMTADALLAFREATRRIDVTELLAAISVPTLVLHRSGEFTPLQYSQEVASMIPEAQLQVRSTGGLLSDEEVDAIAAFLGVSDAASSRGGPPPTSAAGTTSVQTILFTDLASSTALTQQLGDAKAQELVRAHNAIVREALAASGGAEIKHTGDGIMASFPTASGALECAVAIQRAVHAQGVGAHGHAPLQVHSGLNAGEPVAEESDLFGTSVQLARRICDHAQAGQILVSNVVRELAAGKGFLFSDIGEVAPKGFEEPVRLYEVRWREDAEP